MTCDSSSSVGLKDQSELRKITAPTSMASLAAAFGGDTDGATRFLLGYPQHGDPPKINEVQVCDFWGNRRLLFVDMVMAFNGNTVIGQRDLEVVMTRLGAQWELKAVSDLRQRGSMITDLSEALSDLVSNPKGSNPRAPTLRRPGDQARLPRFPNPPELEWNNSGLLTVGYLIESQYFNSPPGAKEGSWSQSVFKLVLQRPEQIITAREPLAVGKQAHRWRIWAINRDGSTAISEWRTINYTA